MPIPLSLYIHIPWCVQKCPYCDFNSHAIQQQLPEAEYVTQLLADLDADLVRFTETRPLTSIFIGGGTPSVLCGTSIQRLIDGIANRLEFDATTEITLEANPGTVDERHFRAYRRAGVNRLSIGVQSFDHQHLKQLGRIHSPEQAISAVKTAQDVGFERINLDLMFALPQQNTTQAMADLAQAIALDTEHLSYYQLTIEPNTVFAHRPPILPPENDIEQIFEQATELLQQRGFRRYEVSAWTREKASLHNLNYWQYGDYLGIGAGAHGKITETMATNKVIIRTTKPRSPKDYLGTKSLRQERIVSESDKAFEFMLNALRLCDGFEPRWLTERGLLNAKTTLSQLQVLADKQLLDIGKQCILPTALGQRFVNDMVSHFLA